MDADDALTELGSVRRLMSEDSAEESEDDSEESADLEEDLDDSVEIRPAVVSLVEAAASVKRGLAAEKARTIDGEGETDENGDNDDEAECCM